MSLLLCLLAITLIGVAGWGFQSVMAELAKSYPQEPVDTISRRFQVDEFIWSPRAPLALRRQYIATQACAIPACLCLAALVWLNEPRPDAAILILPPALAGTHHGRALNVESSPLWKRISPSSDPSF
jgi:hypothetical protein